MNGKFLTICLALLALAAVALAASTQGKHGKRSVSGVVRTRQRRSPDVAGSTDAAKTAEAAKLATDAAKVATDASKEAEMNGTANGNNGNGNAFGHTCQPSFFQKILKIFGLWSCPKDTNGSNASANGTANGVGNGSDKFADPATAAKLADAAGAPKTDATAVKSRRRRSPDGDESSEAAEGAKVSTTNTDAAKIATDIISKGIANGINNSNTGNGNGTTCQPSFFQKILKIFGFWSCPTDIASNASANGVVNGVGNGSDKLADPATAAAAAKVADPATAATVAKVAEAAIAVKTP